MVPFRNMDLDSNFVDPLHNEWLMIRNLKLLLGSFEFSKFANIIRGKLESKGGVYVFVDMEFGNHLHTYFLG